ncbi:hypothetical protein GTY87_34620 [Streptomyces sp. SID7813]|uniref:Uncharacterized protein n=1 Tax=Streptomyces coelicolor (strain ATCC BAA-471 / A3(2) / M145) TaxID=100226 RepID=Q9X7X4_STRCO|nr:hypothetical protein [Streptomyces sp. SID7813]QFI46564.1 hypothetical protein FQ762_34970 [Streptomyces coelicolor A3(2)]CAB39712.1 small hypothetical protein [Streptomyces coelicolor A3(2)]
MSNGRDRGFVGAASQAWGRFDGRGPIRGRGPCGAGCADATQAGRISLMRSDMDRDMACRPSNWTVL